MFSTLLHIFLCCRHVLAPFHGSRLTIALHLPQLAAIPAFGTILISRMIPFTIGAWIGTRVAVMSLLATMKTFDAVASAVVLAAIGARQRTLIIEMPFLSAPVACDFGRGAIGIMAVTV